MSGSAQEPTSAHVVAHIGAVATFNGAMPTGVTVSDGGRIFVNFRNGEIR